MLRYNESQAIETAQVLINARNNREAIFSRCYETPEKKLPPGIKLGSREHASWLFYTSFSEVKVKSKVLLQHAHELYQKKPEIFDPSYVAQNFKRVSRGKIESINPGKNLETIIRDELGHGLNRQIADRWFQNSRIVDEKYDGDVRKILDGVRDVSTAEKRLGLTRPGKRKGYDSFRGFGQKTASLFLMRLTEAGLADIDAHEIEVPIDYHTIDLLVGREVIEFDHDYIHREKFVNFAKDNLKETFRKNRINPIEFKNASWILKSELSNGCVKLMGSGDLCPFEEPCKYRIDSVEYNMQGRIVKTVNRI